jgi:hypothetical protein
MNREKEAKLLNLAAEKLQVKIEYATPFDLFCVVFQGPEDVSHFTRYLIKTVILDAMEADEKGLKILPVNSYNSVVVIDYNYFVKTIAEWADCPLIFGHFGLRQRTEKDDFPDSNNLGFWLVTTFSKIYKLLSPQTLARMRTADKKTIIEAFYSNVIYEAGKEASQFASIAISSFYLADAFPEDSPDFRLYKEFMSYANREDMKNVAYGTKLCKQWWDNSPKKPTYYA